MKRFIVAIGLLAIFSCSKEGAEEPVQATGSYTLSVTAGKGGVDTKALNLDETTLHALWAVGDEVTVYKGENLLGTLTAQTAGSNTTLNGTLTGTIAVNDVLTLKFLSPDYASQDGTLAYIAAHCDYSTAEVTVNSISGGNISTTAASFENQQAIVKFTLKNSAKTADVSAKPLMVTVDGMEIIVTPEIATNELYVAIPAISGKAISLAATTDAGTKGFSKTGVTFEKGKYYTVTVGLSDATLVHNQSELNGAIADGAYIIFANDIPVNAYVKIGQSSTQTVTIDMAGHTLQRTGLASADANGHVIEVFANGNLTLLGGTLTGGWANNGGGICNYGTLSASDITITGCKAAEKGGGIFNNGMLSLSGTVSITGNTVNAGHEGGGIYNNGTLNMEGNIQIKGNTYDDVFLAQEKVITVTGKLTGGAESIGVTKGTDSILTSGYSAHNTANNQFFASGTLDNLSYRNGEVYQDLGTLKYVSCAYNPSTKTVEKTVNDIPEGYNTVTYASTSLNSGWHVVLGENVIVNERIVCNGDVKLIITDGAKLTASKGITVNQGNTLTVYCQSYGTQMGKLVATAVDDLTYKYAAIGGLRSAAGAIVIHGGDIKATATEPHITAIGGAEFFNGGDVIVFDGRVEARGGSGCPGIGSGWISTISDSHLAGGTLTVYGGEVYAYGGVSGAGIGGASNENGADVTIYGGLIEAQGGENGPGIGCGRYSVYGRKNMSSGKLTVYGGDVYAYGGEGSAGIGGGLNGCGATVLVTGGLVKAWGGEKGAGIGSGLENGEMISEDKEIEDSGTLTVEGGEVYAYGGKYAAGIGGGQNAKGATVHISGGKVYAYGGSDAAGVGSGEETTLGPNIEGGTLEVTGGYLYAQGSGMGAGIGGGEDADGASVTITGGTILAYSGGDDGAAAIGSDDHEEHMGTLSITGDLRVYAGNSLPALEAFQSGSRVIACWWRKYARIEPCTEHEYVSGFCKWCGHAE